MHWCVLNSLKSLLWSLQFVKKNPLCLDWTGVILTSHMACCLSLGRFFPSVLDECEVLLEGNNTCNRRFKIVFCFFLSRATMHAIDDSRFFVEGNHTCNRRFKIVEGSHACNRRFKIVLASFCGGQPCMQSTIQVLTDRKASKILRMLRWCTGKESGVCCAD